MLTMNERFASVPETTLTADAAATTNTINASAGQIFAINSDIDELVGDGNIQEFMHYIERIDNETATGDKLNFKEFSEESKRMRYPSYNTGGEADEEIDEFTVIVADETDETNAGGHGSIVEASKRSESKRKTNMFANYATRFIEYERMNEAKLLQSASMPDAQSQSPKPRESLVKSKTVDQFLSSANFAASNEMAAAATVADDANATKLDRIEPEICVIESPSIETFTRRESLTSSVSGESSYFNFKQSSDSESAYTREDSWLSSESNVLFDRSQSALSDLEYIRGRDDWKDHQIAHHIPSEIESDEYHHYRRFSENSDALEYICGREDWLKNEMNAVRSCTLPRIFEHGDRKFLIQDEIDSDEYHHTFYLHEAVRTATELGPRFLVHGSASSGRARSPYKVLHADIDKTEFIQRYYWQGQEQLPTDESGYESLPLEKRDAAEEKMIRNERLIWIQNENSRSQSPLSIDVNAIKVTKSESPTTDERPGSESDAEYEDEIRSDEINEVIDNIIDARVLTEDTLEKSPSEDIEIMVLDLAEKKTKKRPNHIVEPFIIISEATDDEAEQTEATDATEQICESDVMPPSELVSTKQEHVDVVVDVESFEFVNAPPENDAQINIESNDDKQNIASEKMNSNEMSTEDHQSKRNDGKQTRINERSAEKSKAEKFDDLIQEGSMGLWFHK